jgi:prepilin-type N-terminal cleavage/methylation domain-containing protein
MEASAMASSRNACGDSPRGMTLVELLVVAAVIAALVALLLPAIQGVREAGRRTACLNNLRNIGCSLHGHLLARRRFPVGCLEWKAAGQQGSGRCLAWSATILPWLEEQALADRIDFGKAFDDPANAGAAAVPLAVYRCPSAGGGALVGGLGRTDYGGVNGERIRSPNNPEKGALVHDRGFAQRPRAGGGQNAGVGRFGKKANRAVAEQGVGPARMPAAEFVLPGRPVHGIGLVEEVSAVDPLAVGPVAHGALADERRLREAVGDLPLCEAAVVHEDALFGIVRPDDPFASDAAVVAAAQARDDVRPARRRAAVDGQRRGRCGGVGGVVEGPREIDPLSQRLFLEPGKDRRGPRQAAGRARLACRPPLQAADGKPPPHEQMAVQRTADVSQVVEADRPATGLAGRLHRRQQQSHQHRQRGGDDEQLDERHTAAGAPGEGIHAMAALHAHASTRARARGACATDGEAGACRSGSC